MLDILKQVLANYELLWEEWKQEIGDGSWNRAEVDRNIVELEELIKQLETGSLKKEI